MRLEFKLKPAVIMISSLQIRGGTRRALKFGSINVPLACLARMEVSTHRLPREAIPLISGAMGTQPKHLQRTLPPWTPVTISGCGRETLAVKRTPEPIASG